MCLGAVTKTRTNMEEEEEDIGAAPTTITNREELERGTADNYFYMPGLGEVPDIDVPVDLPDLPGVVDDITYRFVQIIQGTYNAYIKSCSSVNRYFRKAVFDAL